MKGILNIRRAGFEKQKKLMALLFIAPWFVGFLLFFAAPLVTSLNYSFHKLQMTDAGYELLPQGFANYGYAVGVHESFNRLLSEAALDMVVNVPLIVIFSLFLATLLNQKFRGRAVARAVFFLPVILASGVMTSIENSSFMADIMAANAESGLTGGAAQFLQSFDLQRMMLESGFPPTFVDYLTGAVDRIYSIISRSGVQVLIFLAGLQSISSSLYEASKIEGATAYEAFWKITFPMVSPLILTNVIYSIIDSFVNNEVTTLINDVAFKQLNFGASSAMAWIYFTIVAAILAVSSFFISRRVFYNG